MIFKSTTSSPEESLASNLQCERVLLSSIKAASKAGEVDEMSPHTKKLCRAERAADVMGPVDKGDRKMAKNGERSSVKSTCRMSRHFKCQSNLKDEPKNAIPATDFTLRFSSRNPAISSASLDLLALGRG